MRDTCPEKCGSTTHAGPSECISYALSFELLEPGGGKAS